MTKAEKLLQKIRNNPKQVSFEDMDTALMRAGFERRQPKGGSSHFYYTHPRMSDIHLSIPYRRPHIKENYVIHALELIDQLRDMEA